MVTPLIDNNTLDRDGTVRLVEHMIAGGVHGIFILGTTGEAQVWPITCVMNYRAGLFGSCGRVPRFGRRDRYLAGRE